MKTPRIRVARPADGAELARIYAPIVRDTVISFELQPPDAASMAERVSQTWPRWPWLVALEGAGASAGPAAPPERLLGYAYAGVFRGRPAYRFSCEVAVYVDAAARRGGLGLALYGALLGSLRRMGLHRAVAGITLPNPASVGLHERIGFRPTGSAPRIGFKQGSWHDVGFWQLDLQAPGLPPCAEPRSFAELEAEPGEARVRSADAARLRAGGAL